ncbi:MAG: HD domain-containing protein [Thermotogota bacterium]|nr:HD domain-containing protein [Thermotogota bacterium]
MIQTNKTKSIGMEITKIHTQKFQTWLQSRKIELESIIQTLGTNINTQVQLNENLIRPCKERPGYFETIFISDLEGRTNDCFKETHTITDRDYYHRIIHNNEEFVISNPLLSKTNDKPSIVIATRLIDKEGELRGLFGATINLSVIRDFLTQIKIDNLGKAVLISKDGQFIAHSKFIYSVENTNEYIQNFPTSIMEEILSSQNGVIEYSSEQVNGAKEFLFFETLNTMPNWKVLIHIPKNAFYKEIVQITVIAWSLLFASIILVIILLMRASIKITEPLETTVSEISSINLKNFDISLPKTKITEINQLTDTFKKMSKKLRYSINEAERTQDELSAAYEELSATNEDLEQSYQQLEKMSHNLEEIFETATQINQAGLKSEEEYLDFLLTMLIDIIDSAEYGSVALFENDKWRFVSAKGHDLQKLQQIDLDKAYHIKTESVKLINNILSNVSRIPEEKMKELIDASKPIGHTMISELKIKNIVVGTISIDSPPEASPFTNSDLRVFEAFTNFATAFLGLKRLFKVQTQFQHQLILAIIKILEIHDPYTKGHSENVGLLSAEIAREMNFDEEEINEIFGAGLVHDIGKINIPNTILLKAGRLTKEEYDEIKKHPVWGAQILDTSENIDVIVKAVRHHHERWDGYGYPDGLSKTDIPLYSRIIAVADTFDAMTSDRSYKRAVSKDIAIEEIKNNSGEQFDPEIVEIFCRIKAKSK